jgi:hypothetical protein
MMRNEYNLVSKCEGTRPLGIPRRIWEDNIKMDLKEIDYEGRSSCCEIMLGRSSSCAKVIF